jgi:hypothetical protein
MPYLVQYQYSYKQKIGSSSQTVQVTLFQKSSLGSGTPVITQLVASKPAFRINVIDNDKDKFRSVRGKQATLLFKPQTGITASTFSSGADDEWIVEAVVVSTGFFLFKGFLVMDDHQQSFLPVSHQYDIELTATDNLGTLKEVPLTDDSGLYIRGYKKIIEVIAQCLRKTGLQLDIIVRDSWMEESQTTFGPACNVTYLQMKTFEKDINEAVSCYDALQIIFGYRLSIKQYNGTWWVENIDEKTTNQAYLFRFDYTGTYVGQEPLAYYIEAIGKNEEIKLLNKDAILSYTRPIKYAQLSYRYEFPKEIIDNMDFSRGALYTPLDMSPVTIDGVTYYVGKYHIDDWTLGSFTPTVNTIAYIRKLYSDSNKTYEKERHIVIEHASPFRNYYLESNGVPINKNDKIIFSCDFKYDSNISNNGVRLMPIARIKLAGNDGSSWWWGRNPSIDVDRWNPTAVDVTFNSLTEVKFTDWQSVNADVLPAPVSGTVSLQLMHMAAGATSKDISFTNLQFEYTPYINGDYSKFGGHSLKIEQAGNFKANVDETVRLGDSPNPNFKGAMFKLVAGKYVLTGNWYAGGDLLRQGIVPPYPPSSVYLHPFGWLQIYAVWNQYNRRMIELSGSATGLKLDNVPPDLIDTYQVIATTDAGTEVTSVKEFMLVGMEQDYQEGQWNLSLAETYDSTVGKDFTTPLTFKYDT